MKFANLWKAAFAAGATAICALPARAQDTPSVDSNLDHFQHAETLHAVAPMPLHIVPTDNDIIDPFAAMEQAGASGMQESGYGIARSAGFPNVASQANQGRAQPQRYGFEIAARREDTRIGLDIEVSRTASFARDPEGGLSRDAQGSEVRVGRDGDSANWYLFAAADDEALTWGPAAKRSSADAGTFALRERAEIGDLQAGVTYERGALQASFAYVEREISVETGPDTSLSREESFTGVTLSVRR